MPARRQRNKRAPSVAMIARKAGRHSNTRARTHAGNHGANGQNWGRDLYQRAADAISHVDLDGLRDNVKIQLGKFLRSGESEIQKASKQWSLLLKMVKSRWDAGQDLPWRTVVAATVAVVYFVGPFDLIPDFIPVVGFLDDAAVLGICYRLIRHDLKTFAETEGVEHQAYGL